MASTVAVTYEAKATVVETLDATGAPGASETKRRVTHDAWNSSKSLGALTTPPATLHAAFEKALAAGTATIDLTALVGTNGIAVNGTGLRVQVLRVRAKSTNANPITIGKGATAGYIGFGTDFSLTLGGGASPGEALIYTADAASDIGPANKTLDLVGTGTQSLEVEIVLG